MHDYYVTGNDYKIQNCKFVTQFLLMHKLVSFLVGIILSFTATAQTAKSYTSAEILLQIKKLNVLGSVLYIAAHPDDENTRLLSYLSAEKLYRTGYLSITRGDGGQNLIGDEQGIDLGLIRTQELLAARRNDGAEQFFTTGYDFGYSKDPDEALQIWNHDKVLSDVVWVIRKFKPDVIITRFPTTGEGGHGHHTASAILASEAFDAAADSFKFPLQFKYGVTTWKPKRLFWNTFNFGGNNTQKEDQLKINVGGFNPVLGKSYGEIAAESRSEHKSQGFGVPAQRGNIVEYFATIKGDIPGQDLMDAIDISWGRINEKEIAEMVNELIGKYDLQNPAKSVPALLQLYKRIVSKPADKYWKEIKLQELRNLIENCSGLFMEVTAEKQLNVIADSIKLKVTVNNRSGVNINRIKVSAAGKETVFENPETNETKVVSFTGYIHNTQSVSQPYWLEKELTNGSFDVRDQELIGKSEWLKNKINFEVQFDNDLLLTYEKQIQYKNTDPVKGELYQPVQVVNPVFINTSPSLILFRNDDKNKQREIQFNVQANTGWKGKTKFIANSNKRSFTVFDSTVNFSNNEKRNIIFKINSDSLEKNSKEIFSGQLSTRSFSEDQYFSLRKISYDHIPDIYYNYMDVVSVMKIDLKTAGSLVGYIPGAGDKIPQALEQMGYKVVILNEADIKSKNLRQFDAIITGIRAYNVHEWLANSFNTLMDYVKDGGVLLTQYNTNNSLGPVKAKISPYSFNISRNRITDEKAKVNFLLTDHPALNYPNKITEKDFDGWIQERSIYNAENVDEHFKKILSMKDPGEKEQDGSLIIADYGKGRFVYTGLVFFRELPAAVPGAFRLFANLIANKR